MLAQDRDDEARAITERTLEIAVESLQQHPEHQATQLRVARLYYLLGRVEKRAGNDEAARSQWLAAVAVVSIRDPGQESTNRLWERVRAMHRLGRDEEARPSIAELARRSYGLDLFRSICEAQDLCDPDPSVESH